VAIPALQLVLPYVYGFWSVVLGDSKWVMFGKIGGVETIEFTDLRGALGLYAGALPLISMVIVVICYATSRRSRKIASLCYEFVPTPQSENVPPVHADNV
jgi:hypothetical protein